MYFVLKVLESCRGTSISTSASDRFLGTVSFPDTRFFSLHFNETKVLTWSSLTRRPHCLYLAIVDKFTLLSNVWQLIRNYFHIHLTLLLIELVILNDMLLLSSQQVHGLFILFPRRIVWEIDNSRVTYTHIDMCIGVKCLITQ